MSWVEVPDRSAGYPPQEADWDDYIKSNINTGTMVHIGGVALASDAATVGFSSIPQTFRHLMVEGYARGTRSDFEVDVIARLNADTGSNYDWQRVVTNDTSVFAGRSTYTGMHVSIIPGASSSPGLFGGFRVWFFNYRGTGVERVAVSREGHKMSSVSASMLSMIASAWRNSAAINAIELRPIVNNLTSGSRFDLYGV